jgi:hypothetical protein
LKEVIVRTNLTELRKSIPKGKARVIAISLYGQGDYLVKDCDTRDEAFRLSTDYNSRVIAVWCLYLYAVIENDEAQIMPLDESRLA